MPWQLAEISGQSPIRFLGDPGGLFQYLVGSLRIKLRIAAQEIEEFLEAAVEFGLCDYYVHFGSNAGDFGKATLVNRLRCRGVERGEVAHERCVVSIAIRQFACAECRPRIRDVTIAHEIEYRGVCGNDLLFQDGFGFALQRGLFFLRQHVRHDQKWPVQRMLCRGPGYLRLEGRQDVFHDRSRLCEARVEPCLHVARILLEVSGERLQPQQVIPIVVSGFETRRRHDIADVHMEPAVREKRYAPRLEFAEGDVVFEDKAQDIGVQRIPRSLPGREDAIRIPAAAAGVLAVPWG